MLKLTHEFDISLNYQNLKFENDRLKNAAVKKRLNFANLKNKVATMTSCSRFHDSTQNDNIVYSKQSLYSKFRENRTTG